MRSPVQVERIVANARAAMAAVALVATFIDPTEPTRFVRLVYGLLGGYTVFALAVALLIGRVPADQGGRLSVPLLIADLVWVTVISFLSEGPNSLFFVFFVYVLLSTAYRWGLKETLLVGAASMVVLDAQALNILFGPASAEGGVEVNRLIIRNAYLLLVAFLAGTLADREKQARGRAVTLASLLAQVHVDSGLRHSLHAVLDRLASLFGASSALVVFEQTGTGRTYISQTRPRQSDRGTHLVIRRLPREDRDQYFFTLPGGAACWEMDLEAGGNLQVTAIAEDGARVEPGTEWPVPEWTAPGRGSLIGVSFQFGHQWSGRLFLLEIERSPTKATRLHFLQDIVRHVGPSLHSLYLLRYLQSRADTMARADVAEELHQGIIQSLVGLEMQLDVLRRTADDAAPGLVKQLKQARETVSGEIRGVRALMSHLRRPVVAPQQLPKYLEELVKRFGEETGISSTFVYRTTDPRLSPRRCREIVNLVREALTNVRKHSGANSVVVDLAPGRLTVTDDGRGIGNAHPASMVEQARLGGAILTIASAPGAGTRLTVDLPEEKPWTPRNV